MVWGATRAVRGVLKCSVVLGKLKVLSELAIWMLNIESPVEAFATVGMLVCLPWRRMKKARGHRQVIQ